MTNVGVHSLLAGKSIAIVGAGPAGLTLARLLQQGGAQVAVFERDTSPEMRHQGGSLDLHEESGLLAIRKAGLEDRFDEVARPEGQHSRVFDKHGKALIVLTAEDERERRPEIDRTELRKLLLSSLRPGTVRWGRSLQRIVSHDAGYRLNFGDGESVPADLVMGCDGAWSKVRPLRSSMKPSYGGVTFIETRLTSADTRYPSVSSLVGHGNVLALGDNKALMAQRNGDGHIRIYVALRMPEDCAKSFGIDVGRPAIARKSLLELFTDWAPSVVEMLQVSDDIFIPRPLYTLPVEQSWNSRSAVTLLGDAAHLMPPFTGKGANMAMLDAVELADCLTSGSYETLSGAMNAYETSMLQRMKLAISETLASQDLLIAPDVENAIREIEQRKPREKSDPRTG